MSFTHHMTRQGSAGDHDDASAVDVVEAAKSLRSEDLALLEAFLLRPTEGLDDVQLAARTMLPLSIVNDRANRLVETGLMQKRAAKSGRMIFTLGQPTELSWHKKRKFLFGR